MIVSTMYHITAVAGRAVYHVFSVNDVGASQSGREVARFNLSRLLKDTLGFTVGKSIMSKLMFFLILLTFEDALNGRD